ncbi:MAG TPA: aminomethyl-transferring glycine dehydrogenase subunit GcvPB [Candidatus Wallbacteria bacterium]|nr:aminomethyl-transferring glycine dehydrogenase subunit GcvPB [Candidatus Wallbacteria bacterium]
MVEKLEKLIFEYSREGRTSFGLPAVKIENSLTNKNYPEGMLRSDEELPKLPQVTEVELMRHFTNLSRLNYSLEVGFYPLGSCTMKYNPKVNEKVASMPETAGVHPHLPEKYCQGMLEILHNMEKYLAEILGMKRVTMQPLAGAHGELTGIMMIKKYHESRGDKRTKVVVPDSSHGTNPATAAMCGFDLIQIKSDANGCVDLEELKAVMDDKVAAFMLTNPNTLGLFDKNIQKIAEIVHKAGALLYYDGANLNAIMGIARPGDMGFDVTHVNLHKTFSTPHGGGGPGSGPVGVSERMVKFLPSPTIEYDEKNMRYSLNHSHPDSIGKVASFYGNFGIIMRAYAYILSLGAKGLTDCSKHAVLNANYLMGHLKKHYNLKFDHTCMHEFVLSSDNLAKYGVTTIDIAKRLLDLGYHAPTIYFPIIVHEAIMIEPTETECKERLDEFIATMIQIAKEAETTPELLKNAPVNTPVSRLDETRAARTPVLRCAACDGCLVKHSDSAKPARESKRKSMA